MQRSSNINVQTHSASKWQTPSVRLLYVALLVANRNASKPCPVAQRVFERMTAQGV